MAMKYSVIKIDENNNEETLGEWDDVNMRDAYFASASESYSHIKFEKREHDDGTQT